LLTLATFQAEMSPLNEGRNENICDMVVTLATFHLLMSELHEALL
jgi:hypothetical protein